MYACCIIYNTDTIMYTGTRHLTRARHPQGPNYPPPPTPKARIARGTIYAHKWFIGPIPGSRLPLKERRGAFRSPAPSGTRCGAHSRVGRRRRLGPGLALQISGPPIRKIVRGRPKIDLTATKTLTRRRLRSSNELQPNLYVSRPLRYLNETYRT